MTTGFPPCGLRYASKPPLAPCIGEEHRPQPARSGAGGSRASLAGSCLWPGLTSWPSRTVMKATAARDTLPDTGTGHADRAA